MTVPRERPARSRHRIAKRLAIGAIAVLLLIAVVMAWAIFNLNPIIARNRVRLIGLVSYRLGRPVTVAGVKVHPGWGIAVELDGLQVADDPSFSKAPFITADAVYLKFALIPLLRRQAVVRELIFHKPVVRLVRNGQGVFNLSTIGRAGQSGVRPPENSSAREAAYERTVERALLVDALGIEDGTVYFTDNQGGAVTAVARHLDLQLTDFSLRAPFNLQLKLALLGAEDNCAVSGTLGPLPGRGMEWSQLPLDLTVTAGPLVIGGVIELIDRVSGIALLPPWIALPDPMTIQASLSGPALKPALRLVSNLNQYRVIYGKGSTGTLAQSSFVRISGATTIQGGIDFARGAREGLRIELSQAALEFGPTGPRISNLDASVALTPGGGIRVSGTTFAIGHARLDAELAVDSFSPLKARFALGADHLDLTDLGPSAPSGTIDGLEVNGTAAGPPSSPQVNALVRSSDGKLAGLAYRNLSWSAGWQGERLTAQPLALNAFGGSLSATGGLDLEDPHGFDAVVGLKGVNLKGLLSWAGVKNGALQGLLSGQVRVAGQGQTWKRIEPGLTGSGRLSLVRGKLRGTNIVATAINKIAAAPGVNILVDAAFRRSHQGLLADPDTELDNAGLSFTLAGMRVYTSDLVIDSADYGISGAGWFDFDDNVSMRGDIRLTLGLSVAIPVLVTGRYPMLIVLPDLPELAKRVAVGTLNAPGNIIRGGINGIGSVLRGARGLLP